MKSIFNKVKLVLRQLRAFLPSKLPVGAEESEKWVDSFFELYELPTKERDSIKWVLVTAIQHLGPTAAFKSKFYFYLVISAAAAKQIAGAKFYELKQEQARKAAEATADKSVASNAGS